MKALAIALFATVAIAGTARADQPLTAEETKSATAAAAAWGCEGGKWEKEVEGTGVYELDDAKCKAGGNFDLKFDKDFKLIAITKD